MAIKVYLWYKNRSAFEFDPKKSLVNKAKHGISFEEAKALWLDPQLTEIEARTVGEPRFLLIGNIEGKCWSAVVTYRGSKIRIISVRRSREEERRLYEED